jgi:hypothetical protein
MDTMGIIPQWVFPGQDRRLLQAATCFGSWLPVAAKKENPLLEAIFFRRWMRF